jgi:hypothetical protein
MLLLVRLPIFKGVSILHLDRGFGLFGWGGCADPQDRIEETHNMNVIGMSRGTRQKHRYALTSYRCYYSRFQTDVFRLEWYSLTSPILL